VSGSTLASKRDWNFRILGQYLYQRDLRN